MRLCDLTLAYTPTSGGIRTYINAKRKYLREHREGDEHILLIPGEHGYREQEGPLTIISIASPIIPGCAPYRFFWRPGPLLEALERVEPDIIELGSFFISPWVAFRYREKAREKEKRCLVSAYFHTDVATAYFGAPLRNVMNEEVGAWSESLAKWGLRLAESIEKKSEAHFGGIFEECDLLFAATPPQRDRLHSYGVEGAHLVPLGVDLDVFHPKHRSRELRERFGADDDTVIILFAGRLDSEKHPEVLVEAFEQCRLENARLVLSGEGALRKGFEERASRMEHFFVEKYYSKREEFARLLASADIYATAGPHETFGLSVIEAQASGLPVVGVDAGALPERIVEGTGYLGPPDDAAAMARNFEKAAEERKQLGENARNYVVEAGYGWETTFETLFAIYDEALSSTP